MTLTEQWKKGELEVGEYYLRYKDGTIDREYYDYASVYDLMVEKGFSTESCDISEVLAPVPSYEEWQQLHKFLEEFNALDVAKENKKIKELLKECHHYIVNTPVYSQGDDVKQAEIHKLLDKIEAVLK